MAEPKATKAPDPVLMGFKAITLAPELSGSGRLVAGVLLEHYNRRTKQCFPTIEAITHLSRLSRATVIRALAEICDDAQGTDHTKLFERWPHHGRSNSTFYIPRWGKLEAVIADYDQAKRERSARRNRKLLPGESSADMGSEVSLYPDGKTGSELSPLGPGEIGSELSPQWAQKRAPNRLNSEPSIGSKVSHEPFIGTHSNNQSNEPNWKTPASVVSFPAREGVNSNGKSTRTEQAIEAVLARLNRQVGAIGDKTTRQIIFEMSSKDWYEAVDCDLRSEGDGLRMLIARAGGLSGSRR